MVKIHTLSLRFWYTDPGARAAMTDIRTTPLQPWGDMAQFHQDYVTIPENVGTMEHNYIPLDGTMRIFPDDYRPFLWGFFSEGMSDENGEFQDLPTLDMYFDSPRRSPGLTFYFYPGTNDYTKSVRVTWYRTWDDLDIEHQGIYELDSTLAYLRESVSYWQRIKIEFLSTNIPYRYVKLYNIDFGITRHMGDKEIDNIRILEEIDPTVESLSTNIAKIGIKTRNSIFSPITSPDFDDMMMRRQMLEIRRDGELFGKFFLDRWVDPHQSGIVFDLDTVDAIGVMDLHRFMGGMYFDTLVTEILDELFNLVFPSGAIKYILDPEFADYTVSGWIPITTCGTALMHLAFAINATCDTSRVGDVRLYPREIDIKRDSSHYSDDKQPFVDMTDLASYLPPTYALNVDPNYTALDGKLGVMPDEKGDHILGWISQSMSDENGLFVIPPKLIVEFSTPHNMEEITLDFGGYELEFMRRVHMVFYDEFDNVLSDEIYTFNKNPGVISGFIRGYRRYELEVLESNAPYRHSVIAQIDYGRSYYIPLNQQYRRGRDLPSDSPTLVRVISHSYTPSGETTGAHNGKLPLGENEITFPEPLHSLTVDSGNAEILHRHANYAIINVTNNNDVIVTGKRYTDNKRTHIRRRQLVSGEPESEKNYEYFTLVSPERGEIIVQELFDHFALPVYTESKVRLGDKEVGYIAQVQSTGRDVVGPIMKLDISNLRSDIAEMVVRGVTHG